MNPKVQIRGDRFSLFLSGLFIMFIFFACEKKEEFKEYSVNADTKVIIGEAGGEILINEPGSEIDGALIRIPEGALGSTVEIQVQSFQVPGYLAESDTSIGIRILPEGLKFSKDVEITLRYPAAISDTSDLIAYYYSSKDSSLLQRPNYQINVADHSICFITDHFSDFIITNKTLNFDIGIATWNGIPTAKVELLNALEGIPIPGYDHLRNLIGSHSPFTIDFKVTLMKKSGTYFNQDEIVGQKHFQLQVHGYALGYGIIFLKVLDPLTGQVIHQEREIDVYGNDRCLTGEYLYFVLDNTEELEAQDKLYVAIQYQIQKPLPEGNFTPLYYVFDRDRTYSLEEFTNAGEVEDQNTNYIADEFEDHVNLPFVDFYLLGTPSFRENDAIEFRNLSSYDALSFLWAFGDGNSSTERNPTHTYQTAGVYTVSLTAWNEVNHNTATKEDFITILPAIEEPDVNFSIENVTGNSADIVVEIIEHGTTVHNIGFYWGWDSDLPDNAHGDINSIGNGPGTHRYTFEGLVLDKTHYILVFVSDSKYGRILSEILSFTFSGEAGCINCETGTLNDTRDGKSYKTVKIGEQWWMAENLAFLPNVSPADQESLTEPIIYVYDYSGHSVSEAKSTDNYQTYGALYNWPAAMGGCPSGWHLPSDWEWVQLEMYLGMDQMMTDNYSCRSYMMEGNKLKEAGDAHWLEGNYGTNVSGFTAIPGGYQDGESDFQDLGYWAGFWSSTAEGEQILYRGIRTDGSAICKNLKDKDIGYSVRCIKDQ